MKKNIPCIRKGWRRWWLVSLSQLQHSSLVARTHGGFICEDPSYLFRFWRLLYLSRMLLSYLPLQHCLTDINLTIWSLIGTVWLSCPPSDIIRPVKPRQIPHLFIRRVISCLKANCLSALLQVELRERIVLRALCNSIGSKVWEELKKRSWNIDDEAETTAFSHNGRSEATWQRHPEIHSRS